MNNELKIKNTNYGYTKKLRKKLYNHLKPYFNKFFKNKESGIIARFSKSSAEKISSDKAIEKSKNNGFSVSQHFEVANKIINLYENAKYLTSKPDDNGDPNVVSITRFTAPIMLSNGEKATAFITLKEAKIEGQRIYSLELTEINKAPA